jgi:hypothetical protein
LLDLRQGPGSDDVNDRLAVEKRPQLLPADGTRAYKKHGAAFKI